MKFIVSNKNPKDRVFSSWKQHYTINKNKDIIVIDYGSYKKQLEKQFVIDWTIAEEVSRYTRKQYQIELDRLCDIAFALKEGRKKGEEKWQRFLDKIESGNSDFI